jgi:hypothetical protein
MNNDPSSTRSKHQAQHTKQPSITKNNAPIIRKTLKERTKGQARFYVAHERKNVENKTKVNAIERLLSNNKNRLRATYVLITKSCGVNISNQVIFN